MKVYSRLIILVLGFLLVLQLVTYSQSGLEVISPKQGQVFHTGQPLVLELKTVPGATITVYVINPADEQYPVAVGCANSQGYYNQTLLIFGERDYNIAGAYKIEIDVNAGEYATVVTVYYQPSYAILAVNVTNNENSPLEHALVSVYNVSNKVLLGEGYTNSSGIAVIEIPLVNVTSQDEVQVIASYPGYLNASKTIYVSAGQTYTLSFTLQLAYFVTFIEKGLPPGTRWAVSFNGFIKSTTTNEITFIVASGTYSYSISPIEGYNVTPSFGSITVNKNLTINVTYQLVYYTVTINGENISNHTVWGVKIVGKTINGTEIEEVVNSTSPTLTIKLPDGNYTYYVIKPISYNVSPISGAFIVNNSAVSLKIFFKQILFNLTFIETGLPSGTMWSVTINGITKTTTGNIITFTLPLGNYSYTISTGPGYNITPSSGIIKLDKTTTISITFKLIIYNVTFIESGLPAGTTWSVTLNGITKSSSSNEITFQIPYGKYNYLVSNVSGYNAFPQSGIVNVNGNIVIQIDFVQTQHIPISTLTSNSTIGISVSNTTSVKINHINVLVYENGTLIYTYVLLPNHKLNINFTKPGKYLFVLEVFTPHGVTNITKSFYAYELTFKSPLNGTRWGVEINGQTYYTTSSELKLILPQGVYNYTVIGPNGAKVESGSISLNNNMNVAVKVPPHLTTIGLIIAIVAIVVAVALAVIVLKK